MKLVIGIPEAVAPMARKLDKHLKTLHGAPVGQPDGSLLTPRLFPRGLCDWVTVIFRNNFQQELLRIADQIPDLQARVDELAAKQRELEGVFDLSATVEGE